jgi:hypothetical protein
MRQAGQHAERDTRTEQAEPDRQKMTGRTGLSEHVCQKRNAKTGLPGQESQDSYGKEGQAEWDMQNRPGQAEQNIINENS